MTLVGWGTQVHVLLEVADINSPFFLELELPEKREGHLDEFVRDTKTDVLDVTYILGSDPDAHLSATLSVDSISGRAEPNEEHGGIIRPGVVASGGAYFLAQFPAAKT